MSYFDKCSVKFYNIRGGDVPDDEYFKIPAISNSKLKYINPYEGGTPALFKEGVPFEFNPSLVLGSALHCILLQPESFELSNYTNKPSAKLGFFIDNIFKFRQEGLSIIDSINKASIISDYYVGKLTPKILRKAFEKGIDYYVRKLHGEFKGDKEIIVLPESQYNACIECVIAFKQNYEIQNLFKDNIFEPKEIYNEFALFCDVEVILPDNKIVTLPIKGKLDNFIIDHEAKIIHLNDLKTTSKRIDYFMGGMYEGDWYDGSFEKLHYYRQCALYLMMLQMYCDYYKKLDSYEYRCNILAVETGTEHTAQLYRVSQAFIDEGIKEFKELICRVAFHEIYGYDERFPESID